MNVLANAKNPYQGDYKKVLCVCSAGLLRSPTAALVLSQEPYNFNTRAAGIEPEYALVPVTDILLHWADEVVCMEEWQKDRLAKMTTKPIKCLNVPDNFQYRDDVLQQFIKDAYAK